MHTNQSLFKNQLIFKTMISYNDNLLGTLTIKRNGKNIGIQIRQGNCLAVFIHVRKDEETNKYLHVLHYFFADVKHLRNIAKSEGTPFFDDVANIRLNLKYKESYKLFKELVKYYPINCYYE